MPWEGPSIRQVTVPSRQPPSRPGRQRGGGRLSVVDRQRPVRAIRKAVPHVRLEHRGDMRRGSGKTLHRGDGGRAGAGRARRRGETKRADKLKPTLAGKLLDNEVPAIPIRLDPP